MPGTDITQKYLDKVLDAATGGLYSFVMRRLIGHLLEVEDTHFHHDSAVLLPDFEEAEGDAKKGEAEDKVTGLAVLRACYFHARTHSTQKIQILGHTDTSGPKPYNLDLSNLRARNVLAALEGDRAGWVAISKGKHKVEDHQQILKWAAKVYGWDCDPGKINNQNNAKTQAAAKEFQKQYNLAFGPKGAAAIAEDGDVGEQSWGAFFDVYMDVLADICDTDEAGLQGMRESLTFVDEARKFVGCGENWPIDAPGMDGHPSRTNRRVEILFFDAGEEPALLCHAVPGACDPGKCDLYGTLAFNLTPIEIDPAPLQPRYRISLEYGDPNLLFDEIKSKDAKDPGVRQRLQAVGFLYAVLDTGGLVADDIDEACDAAWEHFKTVSKEKTDAAAVDRLLDMVRKELLKVSDVDLGRLPKEGEFARVRFPGTYCITPENVNFFGNPSTPPPLPSYRYMKEQDVWTGNPGLGLLPILAKVETKALLGQAGTWGKAGPGVKVHFQLIEPDALPAGSYVVPPPLRSNPVGGSLNVTFDNPAPPPNAKLFNLALGNSPDAYAKHEKERNPPVAGDPQVDNAHRAVGGKRDRPVADASKLYSVFIAGNDAIPTFHDALDLRTAAASTHPNAAMVETNGFGEAAVLFSPAWTGGDRYKLRAFLDPVEGVASDGAMDGAIRKETGTFVTWRIMRISKYMRWDYPSNYVPPTSAGVEMNWWLSSGGKLEDVDFTGVIASELRKDWFDVFVEPEAEKPQPISQATWQDMMIFSRGRVAKRLHDNTLALLNKIRLETLLPHAGMHATNANPSPGIMNFRTDTEYDAAIASAPAQDNGDPWPSLVAARTNNANGFWNDMSILFNAMNDEIIHFFSRNGISGLTLVQSAAMASHTVKKAIPGTPMSPWFNSGWGTWRRGCFVVFGKHAYTGDPTQHPPITAWMPYDHHRNSMHECGHVLYGVHQHTHNPATQLPMQFRIQANEHDYRDLCIMGYQGQGFEDFCGRCHFNHAGWDIHGMPANGP